MVTTRWSCYEDEPRCEEPAAYEMKVTWSVMVLHLCAEHTVWHRATWPDDVEWVRSLTLSSSSGHQVM